MKIRLLSLCAGFVLLTAVACNSETKKEEVTVKEKAAKAPAADEPKKTEISIGPDGAEVKTKSGTEVKVGEKGASVGSKDVKVDIKNKDEKQ